MQNSSKQEGFGSGSLPQYEDGTDKSNKERSLDFPQLQKIYDNSLKQFVDLLQQVDPEITSKLLNSPQNPQRISLPSEEYIEKPNLEPTETTDYNVFPEGDVQLIDEESEVDFDDESTSSIVQRAESPKTTKLAPFIAPMLINFAVSIVLPPLAGTVGNYLTEYAEQNKEGNKALSNLQQGSFPLQGYLQSPAQAGYPQGPYQQKPWPAQGVPAGYSQGPYQPQIPPREGVPAGYSQGPYQPQIPPGEGVQAGYPQGPYQQQSPPGTGVHAGYPQGPYQQKPWPGQGVQAVYFQGPYQQQSPPGEGVYAGYPPGPYQPQTPPGEGVRTGYPQSPYQQLTQPSQGVHAGYSQGPSQQETQLGLKTPGLQRPPPSPNSVYNKPPYPGPEQKLQTVYPQGINEPQIQPGQLYPDTQEPLQGHNQPQRSQHQGISAQGPHQPQTPPGEGVRTGYPQSPYQQLTQPSQGVHAGYPQGPYKPQTPPGEGVQAGYSQGPSQQETQLGLKTPGLQRPPPSPNSFYNRSPSPGPEQKLQTVYPQGINEPQIQPGQLYSDTREPLQAHNQPLRSQYQGISAQGPHQPPTPPDQMSKELKNHTQGINQTQTSPGVSNSAGYPQNVYQPNTPQGQGESSSSQSDNKLTSPFIQRAESPKTTKTPPGIVHLKPTQGPYEPQTPPDRKVPTGYPQGNYYPHTPSGQEESHPKVFDSYLEVQSDTESTSSVIKRLETPKTTKASPSFIPPGRLKPTPDPYQIQTPQGHGVPAVNSQVNDHSYTPPGREGIYPQPFANYLEVQSDQESTPSFIQREQSPNKTKTPPGIIPPGRLKPTYSRYQSQTPTEQYTLSTRSRSRGPTDVSISKMSPDRKPMDKQHGTVVYDKLQVEVLKSLKDIDEQVNLILNKLESK